MKVLIHGNSEKVLDYKLGNIIDSFNLVVRCNDYVTEGYEEYVGSKTDYAYISVNHLNRLDELKTKTQCIALNYPNCPDKWKHILKDPDLEIITFPSNIYKKITKHNLNKAILSGGMAVIAYFLNDPNNDVYIHGIADGGKHHYFDLKFKVWEGHDLNWEKIVLDKVLKVKRLVDFV